MALDDRQHVEAVAIIRRLMQPTYDRETMIAAEVWLRENHPEPAVYINALASSEEQK
jgi:hypothetical protein